MAKNYMKEVAAMLGVELGEEFEVEGMDGKFVFETSGLKTIGHLGTAPVTLYCLLSGASQIVRRPWRPKIGQPYWTVAVSRDGIKGVAPVTQYDGDEFDFNNILAGNCFPSREAAEAAAPKIVKFYENVRRMVEEG